MVVLDNGVIVNTTQICFSQEYKGTWDIYFNNGKVFSVSPTDYEKIMKVCKLQSDILDAASKALI